MKRISLLLIVILLASLLAACGGEEATSPPADEGADTPAPEASTAESPSPDSGTGVSEPSPEAGSNLSGILWKWESYTGTGDQGDITVRSPEVSPAREAGRGIPLSVGSLAPDLHIVGEPQELAEDDEQHGDAECQQQAEEHLDFCEL